MSSTSLVRSLLCGATLLGVLPEVADAHPGVGIVMDRRGNVFYTDLHHVWRITPEGARTIAVRNVHTELYLDAQGNLYGEHLWYEGEATDKWGHRVWRRAADGTLSDVISAREGFLADYSFVRDRAGNMYWAQRGASTVIRRRSPSGVIGDHSLGPFRDVRWMTVTHHGVIYMIDAGDLVRIDADGGLRTVARRLADRSLTQFFVGDRHAIMGLWTDGPGNVYLAVYAGRLVKKVAPNGRITTVARSRTPWSPTGGMVAANGDLWLLEYSISSAARVRRIGKDGREKVFG